jgi:hypothetical protein
VVGNEGEDINEEEVEVVEVGDDEVGDEDDEAVNANVGVEDRGDVVEEGGMFKL